MMGSQAWRCQWRIHESLRCTPLCIFAFSVVFVLVGCALPTVERQPQDFVSEKEISILSLAREGLNYAKRGRLLDAELKFRQGLYLAPESDSLKLNLAVVLDRQGLFAESEKIYQALLEEEPESLTYLSGMAHVKAGQYLFREADQYYAQALDLAVEENRPAEAATLARSRSALAFLQGDEEKALCWSLFALAQQRDANQVYRHAKLLLALDFVDRAGELLEKVATGQGADPRYFSALSVVYYAKEELERAEEIALPLLARRQLDPKLSYELSLIEFLTLTDSELEAELKDLEDEEDDPRAIFGTEPTQSEQALYWPVALLEVLEDEEQGWEELEEQKNRSLIWYQGER